MDDLQRKIFDGPKHLMPPPSAAAGAPPPH
jgi:hypothetical protein